MKCTWNISISSLSSSLFCCPNQNWPPAGPTLTGAANQTPWSAAPVGTWRSKQVSITAAVWQRRHWNISFAFHPTNTCFYEMWHHLKEQLSSFSDTIYWEALLQQIIYQMYLLFVPVLHTSFWFCVSVLVNERHNLIKTTVGIKKNKQY